MLCTFAPDPNPLVLVRPSRSVPERNYARLSCGGLPEPPDQTLQLTDSIWQCFYQRGGSGNAYEIYAARDHNASPIGQEFQTMF